MRVRDAMQAPVGRCAPETPLAEVAALMRQRRTGAVPVCANGRIVGLLTDRDIVVRGFRDGRDPGRLTARDVMTEHVVTCRAGDGLAAARRLMEENRIRRLPVLDGDGRLVGLLGLCTARRAADGLHAPGGDAHLDGRGAARHDGPPDDTRNEAER